MSILANTLAPRSTAMRSFEHGAPAQWWDDVSAADSAPERADQGDDSGLLHLLIGDLRSALGESTSVANSRWILELTERICALLVRVQVADQFSGAWRGLAARLQEERRSLETKLYSIHVRMRDRYKSHDFIQESRRRLATWMDDFDFHQMKLDRLRASFRPARSPDRFEKR